LNLTLAELAAMSGVSRSMLSEIERGNANPTYGTLWHLTRALKIDLNSLISGASEERGGGSIIDLQPEQSDADHPQRGRQLHAADPVAGQHGFADRMVSPEL
jgi:transcriptional regulator with XRE-family HTH domain